MNSSIRFLVLLTVLVLGACSPRQKVSEVDIELEKQVIRALGEKAAEVYMQRDGAGYASYFEDDGRMIWGWGSGQLTSYIGHGEIQRAVEEGYAENPYDEWGGTETDLVIAESGNLAYQYGTNYSIKRGLDGKGEVYGYFLTTWRKSDGRWKIVSDTSFNYSESSR